MTAVAVYIASFLLGAIPFGFLLARARGIDIRQVGSGNIGATNVSRALGSKAGIFVLFLDVLKGAIPAAFGYLLLKDAWGISPADHKILLGVIAVLGHIFSPFLKFKGGKGIATGLGALLGASPFVALGVLIVFMIFMLAWRYVSLASIAAATSLPFFAYAFGYVGSWIYMSIAFLLAVLIWVKHIPNIKRLRARTEPKFAFKKPEESHGDRASG